MTPTLLQKIQSGAFVHTVEINPPAGHDPIDACLEVEELPWAIDAIDLTNCAFSKVRLSPIALGHLIQQKYGKEVIVNYTCRDRNIIATKSDLLGALALGVRNVLCMTGDDPKIGDHPEATGVFDLDTCALIRVAKALKIGETKFSVSAATAVETDEVNKQKIEAKVAAGADYFITQPVYTIEDVEKAAELQECAGRPFILGVLAFKSAGMAKRLSEVPGIHVPSELVQKFEKLSQEACGEFSVESLLPIAKRARELLSGLHIMCIGEIWKVQPLIEASTISFSPTIHD